MVNVGDGYIYKQYCQLPLELIVSHSEVKEAQTVAGASFFRPAHGELTLANRANAPILVEEIDLQRYIVRKPYY